MNVARRVSDGNRLPRVDHEDRCALHLLECAGLVPGEGGKAGAREQGLGDRFFLRRIVAPLHLLESAGWFQAKAGKQGIGNRNWGQVFLELERAKSYSDAASGNRLLTISLRRVVRR
jgi:hypothetical protein